MCVCMKERVHMCVCMKERLNVFVKNLVANAPVCV